MQGRNPWVGELETIPAVIGHKNVFDSLHLHELNCSRNMFLSSSNQKLHPHNLSVSLIT